MASVHPVAAQDYPALGRFLAAFDGSERSSDFWIGRFHTWWDANPAFGEDLTRGFVLVEGDRMVGFLGVIPSVFQLSRRPVVAGSLTTWRVFPEYRNESLKLLFAVLERFKDTLVFNTTATDVVIQVLGALRFLELSSFDRSTKLVRAVRAQAVLAALFEGKGWSTLLSRVGAPALELYQTLRLQAVPREGADARELEQAGDEFRALWKSTEHLYHHTNVRSPEMINWYCFSNANFRKQLFGGFLGGQLAAYAVMRQVESRGLRAFECVDWWPPIGPRAVTAALVACIRMAAEDYDRQILIFAPYAPALAAELRRLGCLPFSGRSRPAFVKARPDLMKELSADAYFVTAQGDYGL